jgi:hypothetical protein
MWSIRVSAHRGRDQKDLPIPATSKGGLLSSTSAAICQNLIQYLIVDSFRNARPLRDSVLFRQSKVEKAVYRTVSND